MPKKTYYKKLTIDGNFDSFKEFYDYSKILIYKAIIETFEGFKTTKKKNLNLLILAKIQDMEWDTEFTFHRNNTIILTRDLIPYFEQIEDYETCGEITQLYNQLSG